jgi:hypothetical protein
MPRANIVEMRKPTAKELRKQQEKLGIETKEK